jgi:hypothetical protein
MPGAPSTDSKTDGQAAEILTYLTLPVGVITMEISHDDAFSASSGANPQDSFGRVELASDTGATTTRFSFAVTQAGTYPFRIVWENGTGGSIIKWSTVKADGSTVLVNDTTNGGIPAHRALTTPSAPYVRGANPPAVPRQTEAYGSSVSVVLADGGNTIADSSVAFQLDGKPVNATPKRQGGYLTIATGPISAFSASGEAHTGVLTFKDSAGKSRTQQWTIYNLQNLVLPAKPAVIEDFNSYPEASSLANVVPPNWTAINYTLPQNSAWDLTTQNSAAYVNWAMISTDTAAAMEKEVMQNDPNQLINGQPIGDAWMTGNLLFAASDGRNGNGDPQVQIVITKPFDLSSVKDPVLTFYSGQRISDNRSEADAVEYSADGGKTWLPGAYYHFRTLSTKPDGSYDAVAMLMDPNNAHVPTWTVPGVPGISGGYFEGANGVPVSQALAPFIAERTNNQKSRRVEAIRLFGANQKSDVRIRFVHVGSCGWEWAIDNVAVYDIPSTVVPPSNPPHIDSIAVSKGTVSITWSNGGTLESAPALGSAAVWTSTGNSSGSFSEPAATSGNKFYRIKQ